jgi:thiol-disulfide isomerase/thioredoxin
VKRDLWALAPWLGAAIGISVVIAVGAVPNCASAPPAPSFSAPLVSGPDAGARVSLEGLAGEVVVLDFWAAWCPPCRASIPILNDLAARYPGARFYGVNVEGHAAERVARSHEGLGAEFPTLHDPNGEMQRAYAVRALPTLFVLDREGRIRHAETGVADEEAISELLDELLVAEPAGP